jgi:arylsulfatase A-like enzyme
MGDLPKGIWSLPAAMHRAGYATAWVGKCHVHPPRTSRKQKISEALKGMGFDYAVASVGRAVLASRVCKGVKMDGDVYIEHLKKYGLLQQYIDDCKNRRPVTSLPEEHYLDGFYTNTALEWLENYDGKKPFFLWLNLSCPHGPHDVPQKYHDLYQGKEIPGPLTTKFGGEIPAGLLKDNRPARPAQVGEHRRGFAAATTFVDAMLGKMLEKLKAKGELDDTVLVFFSDHGIFMGNHGRFHKGSVFNEICNPSLIVWYPKKFRKGAVEKRPVELVSVLKTTMDIARASEADKKVPFGESLMPLLTGKGNYKTKYVFSEIEGFQSCYDGRYRYIANDIKPLLYDLKNDPGEMKNIAAQNPEIAARMKKATEEWFAKTGAPLPASALRDSGTLKNWKRP